MKSTELLILASIIVAPAAYLIFHTLTSPRREGKYLVIGRFTKLIYFSSDCQSEALKAVAYFGELNHNDLIDIEINTK
jgi:hypothetical protein